MRNQYTDWISKVVSVRKGFCVFGFHGFCSDGRHDVSYWRFKDFNQPYNDVAKARMAGMKAFFQGVGTEDTAGIWEGAPNLRPDFRAAHQKKLDKLAKAAKAEEMI